MKGAGIISQRPRSYPAESSLRALGDIPNLKPAARLLHELVTADEFNEFLTLPAYELLA